MTPRHTLATAVTIGVAALATGCGLPDPYTAKKATSRAPATAPPTTTNADPAPERGGHVSAAHISQPTAAAATPQAALERFARIYVNWSAGTVADSQRRLATLSVGQAHAQALQAAASYRHDTTLQASHVRNTGQLVSISHSLTAPSTWVLVTSEQTTGAGDYSGLPATLHITYAQTAQTPSGWVISEWAPQN